MKSVRRLVLFAVATISVSSCAGFPFGGCKQEGPKAGAVVPDSFVVTFETSRGRFDVMAHKPWSPLGVGRLYELVQSRHFDDARFFRVIKDFAAQFGLSGDPKVNDAWSARCIADEPVQHPNTRGTLSYAQAGPGTRSVQMFINIGSNTSLDTLDGRGFPPFGQVVLGMDVVDSLYSGYGDVAPRSGPQYGLEGPAQDSIRLQGNAYLMRGWPKLDYIKTARVVQEWK
ncbi:MAG TPA: peptidylprolyl isomerase [Gemmatimonadaceae bacterium]|nr:peptidylprolyl isomerase [Gemmatimonadaceae bacterium]